jgi:hypothetical protein
MLQTAWIKRNQCHRNWLAHPDVQWVGVPIWIQAHKIQRWATGQTIREANPIASLVKPLDQESLRLAIRMALRDHEED